MTLYEDLKWRGLIKDVTSPELEEKLNNEKLTFYIGTDPTADSMHIGHYSSFLIAKRLAKAGHKPILLIGGATGRIGDPRPTTEREMKDIKEIEHNTQNLKKQAEEIFGFEVVDNYDWIKNINVIDFLRDYGKYFNINYMLDKDIIRRRLETGITFTEFSYMLLQSLDFLHLHETRGVSLQVAGSDQWGNITSGVDLIRKKTGDEVYAFTMPLILDQNGKKFGKSEGNALWLDKCKTSSYELYQYLINTDDPMIESYLKVFTFLSKEEIMDIVCKHQKEPHLRLGQKVLAREIITDLHGKDEYEKAVKISENLFNGNIKNISADDLIIGLKDVPHFKLEEKPLLDLLVDHNICTSKREAREFLNNNAISVNGEIVHDENMLIDASQAIDGKIVVIRRGKKKYFVGIVED